MELCNARTNILSLDEETVLREAKNIDMDKILSTIRSNGVYNGIMYILLLNMSAHLTREVGMAPGGEFRVAFKEVTKQNRNQASLFYLTRVFVGYKYPKLQDTSGRPTN